MKLTVSGTLLRFVGFQRVIDSDAESVGAALEKLATEHPQVRPVLYDDTGKLRAVHQLFVNGEQMAPQALNSPIAPNSHVEVLTAIAGG